MKTLTADLVYKKADHINEEIDLAMCDILELNLNESTINSELRKLNSVEISRLLLFTRTIRTSLDIIDLKLNEELKRL